MILQEQIEELLSRPADERRRLLRLLEESLTGEREGEPEPERNGEPPSSDGSSPRLWIPLCHAQRLRT